MAEVVLAYLRFSSLQMQGKGSSIARQRDLVDRWVDEYQKLTGKPCSVSYYIDRGKSAFDGTNITEGNLGRLLEEVKSGMHPQGSHIVVESLDRLTRQGIQHVQHILDGLTKTGCIVHTIADRQDINNKTLNTLGGIVTICAIADRAREESETKSRRVSDSKARNHKLALEGKKLVTSHLPGWITKNSKGELSIITSKQKTIESIFKIRLEGYSFQAIANSLNDSQTPVLNEKRGAKHWLANSVRQLLRNRALIGYLPASRVNESLDEIPNYFPVCISEQLFLDVQATNVPSQKGSRLNKAKATYPESVYLFKKLAICKHCGGNVFPNGAKQGYWGRLRCMGNHNKTCDAPAIPRYDFEHSLMTGLFPMLKNITATSTDPSLHIQSELEQVERKITNVQQYLEDSYDRELRVRYDELKKQRESLKQQLVTTKRNLELSQENTLSDLDFNNYGDRLTMQRIIARTVSKLVVDTFNDTVHIRLLNDNVIYGFKIYGDSEGSFTLNRAIQDSANQICEELGIPSSPTVYLLSESSDITPDFTGWPESDT